ncbi:hypothetical protein [Microvirga pudoricolor]|uniref:hypothetical protein n=1 Tax=Microvirga pudoricolor TaxID=2778729 RepID=UPI00194FCC4E|nr:hypothetical protein [Microvirga pudoricolor]MBM6594010.1 hypothetical protein [Microvirga pudoricolor]
MTQVITNISVLERSSGNGEQSFQLWTSHQDTNWSYECGPRFKSGEVRKFCRTHGLAFKYDHSFGGYLIYAYTPAEQVHFKLRFGVSVLLASEWVQFLREEQERQDYELACLAVELQAQWHAQRAA